MLWKPTGTGIQAILLIDGYECLSFDKIYLSHVKERCVEIFQKSDCNEYEILTLFISTEGHIMKSMAEEDRLFWSIDVTGNQLVIYENQVDDFYGLKSKLEVWLEDNSIYKKVRTLRKLAKCNIGIILLNCIIFLFTALIGSTVYDKGAISLVYILEGDGFYRFISSMFLHADAEHLFSNMLMLYFLGDIVEKEIKPVKYSILYMLSGIGAGVASVWYELFSNQFTPAVGASGAIFGIMGALLFLVLIGKKNTLNITTIKVLFLIGISCYYGFTSTNIDNAAHIGGLFSGFIIMTAIYFITEIVSFVRKRIEIGEQNK